MFAVKNLVSLFVSCLVPLFYFTFHHPSMAYNREWDRGKDSWNDGYAWSGQDDRVVRDHDDGYSGDGKRRKFNNGVTWRLLILTRRLICV